MNRARALKGHPVLVLCILAGGAAHAQGARRDQQLGVEQIVVRLSERNEARNAALKTYESRRLMTVKYQGPLSQGEATETVLMKFSAPASKQFTVLAATGSQLIRDNVFQRALTSEQAATANDAQQASRLNLTNYSMKVAGREQLAGNDCYVLDVAPKLPSEFTYVGRVWVQATDFAVVRIQGRPAVNPSPWTSGGEFTTDFQKVGDFYLPLRTVSSSNLPLGMTAQLTIEYGPYQILSAAPLRPSD